MIVGEIAFAELSERIDSLLKTRFAEIGLLRPVEVAKLLQNPCKSLGKSRVKRLLSCAGLAIVPLHESCTQRLTHTPTLPSMVLSRQGDLRPAKRDLCT
ncbi:hypothetical protein [Bradyrhizobium sp. ISRA463]|uniref:hypothetical protein n=1 Tax=Bradyrhizobium sp. ISRA463 TaxID=2866199 RepID=UPI002478A4EA|nr:hypothetical protein [Bradyrhizobium sp. ISRA463]WGS22146.1 hypothetical protein MTX22_10920 [Bradyrhizobium sp. ISRA463]